MIKYYHQKMIKGGTVLLTFMVFFFIHGNAQNPKIWFTGFQEINLSSSFGSFANEEQEELHHMYPAEADYHLSSNNIGFGISGFDLITTSQLSDNLIAVSELNFDNHDSKIIIEPLQLQIQYMLNEKFNIRAGKFLTPIGYLNLNQRHLGYLNYSLLIREMVDQDYAYVPTTMIGAQILGKFISNALTYEYKLAIGKNRGALPNSSLLSATFDHLPGIVLSNELKKSIKSVDVSLGIGGYFNPDLEILYLDSLGESITLEDGDHQHSTDTLPSEETQYISIREIGLTPYLKIDAEKIQFLLEYHMVNFSQLRENHDHEHDVKVKDYSYNALSAQVILKTSLAKKPFYPYIRYDMSQLNNGGYFYGLNSAHDSEEVTRAYLADKSTIMIGAAWDILPFNRIKLEYMHRLDGVGLVSNINFATAFSF